MKIKPIKAEYKIRFRPKEDITAFELAECMRVVIADMVRGDSLRILEEISDEAKRHYEKVYL